MPSSNSPTRPDDLLREAMALLRQGRFADAALRCERVLEAAPRHVEALHLLGMASMQMGRIDRALELVARAVALKPDHVEALSNLGNLYRRAGRPDQAIDAYDKALAQAPGFADAHANRGAALLDLGRADAALRSFDAALALNPRHVGAHCNRGAALQKLKQMEEALAAFDRAVEINPNMAEAHANRGNVLRELGRLDEALAACDRALAVQPRYVGAHVFRGYALLDLQRPREALQAFEAALSLRPANPRALLGRGRALFDLGKADEAVASYDAALARAPDQPQAHFHRAIALGRLARHAEAVEAASTAIALSPELLGAYVCRADSLLELGRPTEALRDREALARLAPDADYALGHYIHAKSALCDWQGLEALVERLVARIEAGERAAYPFSLLSVCKRPDVLLKCAALHAPCEAPAQGVATNLRGGGGERIRLGYFSSDFYDHPAAHLIAGTLARHDRRRFEVFAYSFGARRDEMTERIRGAVDQFIDLEASTPREIVDHARRMGLDVAIDLNGYTKHARTGVFATRAAPVQMSYLGFLGTMGAPYMDYLIADPVLVPEAERAHYSEKLVVLPWYQCNDERANAPGEARPRAHYGLPDDAFVFCSFNSSFKITPAMFASWMRILARTPRSVLWLYASEPAAARNLAAAAAEAGFGPDRVVFAAWAPREEHLARQRRADLMLDTSPYNGGATSSNALRAGVPVLTLAGRTFSSRMGASLLTALGLPELIAEDAAGYEDAAVRLAERGGELAALKHKIAATPLSDLFNAAAFARRLEHAYAIAVERARTGAGPEDILVP